VRRSCGAFLGRHPRFTSKFTIEFVVSLVFCAVTHSAFSLGGVFMNTGPNPHEPSTSITSPKPTASPLDKDSVWNYFLVLSSVILYAFCYPGIVRRSAINGHSNGCPKPSASTVRLESLTHCAPIKRVGRGWSNIVIRKR
jgi:hypothetical protein